MACTLTCSVLTKSTFVCFIMIGHFSPIIVLVCFLSGIIADCMLEMLEEGYSVGPSPTIQVRKLHVCVCVCVYSATAAQG